MFYLLYNQQKRQDDLSFYVRTATDPDSAGSSIRQVVASLDSNLPLRELKTMQAQLDENVFAERLLSSLTTQFSGLATLLASLGLYGVLSFNVVRRTREIGIRMALGSSQFGVRWLVLREAGAMLCLGALIGMALALALVRALHREFPLCYEAL